MQIINSVSAWQAYRKTISSTRIGFVPTMGNLHQGHASLLQRSQQENEITLLSIFVNPTQFNQATDLQHYPRTLEADLALAESLGVDAVFCPTPKDIYGDDYRYQIQETALSLILDGEKRPGHFTGVLTVVMKLFQLVRPTTAYFGEKDYQQYCLIKGMIDAFFLDIKIVPCPTVREPSGLAMSSRNNRLTEAEKIKAAEFAAHLQSAKPPHQIMEALTQAGFEVDYITDYENRRYGAVTVGAVRLIDNTEISA